MEIVFLGTGSGIPSKERNHPAIFMHYNQDNMLFDCGEGAQRQMMTASVSFMKIDRIFITHWHADHFAGLIGLMQSMNLEGRKAPLHIYGPEADLFVEDILDLGYWGIGFQVVPVAVDFEGNDISTVYENEDFSITSIPVVHSVPSVAYCFKERDRWNIDLNKAKKFGLGQGPMLGKLKASGSIVFKDKKISLEDVADIKVGMKVVYSGDTRPCDNIVKLAKDADILIHDSTFVEEMVSERKRKAHPSVKETAEIAKRAGAKKLILTHFSRRYKDVNEFLDPARKIFPNTEAARDFMRISLKTGPDRK